LGAKSEKHHGVVLYIESSPLCNFLLAGFDGLVVKLLNLTAADTDNVVVVIGTGQLEHRPVSFKLQAPDQTSLFALGHNPVNGCNTDIISLLQQQSVYIFCT